jgi:hypothetical protein
MQKKKRRDQGIRERAERPTTRVNKRLVRDFVMFRLIISRQSTSTCSKIARTTDLSLPIQFEEITVASPTNIDFMNQRPVTVKSVKLQWDLLPPKSDH